MIISVIILGIAWILGFSLAMYNLKVLKETKQERLEARKSYKKVKNERLRRFYGLK